MFCRLRRLSCRSALLKTSPSTSRISRRITLSRVRMFPVISIRLTKACRPSVISRVTFTLSAGRRMSVTGATSAKRYPRSA